MAAAPDMGFPGKGVSSSLLPSLAVARAARGALKRARVALEGVHAPRVMAVEPRAARLPRAPEHPRRTPNRPPNTTHATLRTQPCPPRPPRVPARPIPGAVTSTPRRPRSPPPHPIPTIHTITQPIRRGRAPPIQPEVGDSARPGPDAAQATAGLLEKSRGKETWRS